jgi:oxalate decarboxylase/phosphoglucose isomerase-like protein (cupin superfamily)
MATAGQAFENPLTGERMVFRKTAHETNGTLLEIEFFIKPHTGKGLGAHIHPSFDERFEIFSGSARYMIRQDECFAAAGDVVVLPKAIPHVHPWNAGDDVLHMRRVIQFSRPEMSMLAATEAFLETLYALAQQGKVEKNGLPKNFLQTVVVAQAIQPATYVAGLPVVIQRPLFAALAAYGRARGYKAYYPALSNSALH